MDLSEITNKATEEQISRIKEELGEDDDRFKHNLVLLQKWIECHPFIPKNYEQEMLTIYIRNCKHNIEKTKKKLEAYFVHKKRYPEAFTFHELPLSGIEQNTFNNFYFFGSKNLTPDGYTVCYAGFRVADNNCDMEAVCRMLLMFATFKANKGTMNSGDIVVINLSVFSPAISASILTPLFKRSVEMTQTAFAFRIKAIYITHCPSYATGIINIVKLFFKEKIRKRISIETGDKSMKQCIPDYCIPKDFGGTDVSVEEGSNNWIRLLNSNEHWYREHDKVQAVGDIPKEVYAMSGIHEELGTQGSFRQLTID